MGCALVLAATVLMTKQLAQKRCIVPRSRVCYNIPGVPSSVFEFAGVLPVSGADPQSAPVLWQYVVSMGAKVAPTAFRLSEAEDQTEIQHHLWGDCTVNSLDFACYSGG